jgi:hypothetical protein
MPKTNQFHSSGQTASALNGPQSAFRRSNSYFKGIQFDRNGESHFKRIIQPFDCLEVHLVKDSGVQKHFQFLKLTHINTFLKLLWNLPALIRRRKLLMQ